MVVLDILHITMLTFWHSAFVVDRQGMQFRLAKSKYEIQVYIHSFLQWRLILLLEQVRTCTKETVEYGSLSHSFETITFGKTKVISFIDARR